MSEPRYPVTSIAIHWITLVFVVAAFGLGAMLENPPEGWGDTLYRLHWSFGLSVLAITLWRIINRFTKGTPPPYAGLTPLERGLSQAVHGAIYLLLIAAPLLGWLGKSAYGGEITVFGLFNMPPLLAHDDSLGEKILGAHKVVVKVLFGAIVLHVAGALNHALIKKDGVLRRMLPGA